jgi:ATP-dependent DNA helicase RecQ
VKNFAARLADELGLPCKDVVRRARDNEPQKTMANSAQQYENVRGAFEVEGAVPSEPVFLIDDMVDSRWTFTAVAWKLRHAGAGPVFPFALADTAGRSLE